MLLIKETRYLHETPMRPPDITIYSLGQSNWPRFPSSFPSFDSALAFGNLVSRPTFCHFLASMRREHVPCKSLKGARSLHSSASITLTMNARRKRLLNLLARSPKSSRLELKEKRLLFIKSQLLAVRKQPQS